MPRRAKHSVAHAVGHNNATPVMAADTPTAACESHDAYPEAENHEKRELRVKVTKKLSWVLRRGAREAGIQQDSDGWVYVRELLDCKYFRDLSREQFLSIVSASNDALKPGRPRYDVTTDGMKIRANNWPELAAKDFKLTLRLDTAVANLERVVEVDVAWSSCGIMPGRYVPDGKDASESAALVCGRTFGAFPTSTKTGDTAAASAQVVPCTPECKKSKPTSIADMHACSASRSLVNEQVLASDTDVVHSSLGIRDIDTAAPHVVPPRVFATMTPPPRSKTTLAATTDVTPVKVEASNRLPPTGCHQSPATQPCYNPVSESVLSKSGRLGTFPQCGHAQEVEGAGVNMPFVKNAPPNPSMLASPPKRTRLNKAAREFTPRDQELYPLARAHSSVGDGSREGHSVSSNGERTADSYQDQAPVSSAFAEWTDVMVPSYDEVCTHFLDDWAVIDSDVSASSNGALGTAEDRLCHKSGIRHSFLSASQMLFTSLGSLRESQPLPAH
eukprot:gnl/TRDRNA2_/TRDRNA2_184677_c0_seq1.p1 gnl/TRDRNA2_/TRDRNA2_184677_c0~~gnl/TRDRNA2_/TRDRNA2_184677_c0_seq1.p1  ORF type:complete len:502 (-),score=58.86 gnl/TRDRNA2_/TRDRNA2_184677_c0_seq1:468-1973(-)